MQNRFQYSVGGARTHPDPFLATSLQSTSSLYFHESRFPRQKSASIGYTAAFKLSAFVFNTKVAVTLNLKDINLH